jgi:hypothetical protein
VPKAETGLKGLKPMPLYFVKYVRNGETCQDEFDSLSAASADLREKRRIDAEGIFDDRFALWIEDETGQKVVADEV